MRKSRMCGVTVHTFIKQQGTAFERHESHPCYLNESHEGPHRC